MGIRDAIWATRKVKEFKAKMELGAIVVKCKTSVNFNVIFQPCAKALRVLHKPDGSPREKIIETRIYWYLAQKLTCFVP
jgi:hypothetical protein